MPLPFALSCQRLGLLVLLAATLAPTPGRAQAARGTKRGVAYGYHSAADLQALAPGVAWWYNWATAPDGTGAATVYQGLGIDYVPMQWGGQLNGAPVTAAALGPRIPAGSRYLLGFNEPNFRDQANLTPSQAAALWPQLQAVAVGKGLQLGSPAVNYCGNCVSENGTTYYSPVAYLDAFFAACPGCQVDYIAVHTYVCEERYLREKIGELKKYNKPIWLTEFACGDMAAAQITPAVQQKYLLDAVNYLEKEPAVFRYAWFSGRNSQIPNINLLGADGQLTALGQRYVSRPAGWEPGRLAVTSATASSQETPATGPRNVTDQDINSRWASALGAGTQTLQLDFGTPQSLGRVLLSWEAAYATHYQLLTSLDGIAWTPLLTVTDGDGGLDELGGFSRVARYLRLDATERGTSYGYSLYEVEAFAPTGPLPTQLVSFEATPQRLAVDLSWTTATELRNRGFGVERSADGQQFAEIAFVPGAGSSATVHTYQYHDAQPLYGATSYYRLRQDDTSGASTYSAVQAVTAPAVALSLYPNPATATATVQWLASAAGVGRWRLTNTTGQLLWAAVVTEQAGPNELPLDLLPYPPGSYVLTLESADGSRQHLRLLKAE